MYLLVARLITVGSRRHAAIVFAALVADAVAAALAFAASQGCTVTQGLYWAVTTATTVGYGDVTPHNGTGRVVASLFMLTSIPMLGALFAILTAASVSAGLRRIMQLDHHFPAGRYRLVVGTHPTVPAIVHELVKAKDAVVVLGDIDPSTLPEEAHVIRGDPTDPAGIRKARPAGAQHALVTASSDGDVLVTAVLLRQAAPDLPVTALTSSATVRDALQVLGVDQIVSVEHLVAHTLAKSLETPHAGDLLAELIDSEEHRLAEVPVDERLVGVALSDARRERGRIVLGLVQNGRVWLGVGSDPVIGAGDHLLVAEPLSSRPGAAE